MYVKIPPSNFSTFHSYTDSDTIYSAAFLLIEKNEYDSAIPTEIGQLKNLTGFYARETLLSGDLEIFSDVDTLGESKKMFFEIFDGAPLTFVTIS